MKKGSFKEEFWILLKLSLMPRANRFFIPGHIYHLTHRCHDRKFLLKFDKDKKVWLSWLFEAKPRFQLSILNYVVTFNHIHLIVQDTGEEVIANSIKLIASASGSTRYRPLSILVYLSNILTPNLWNAFSK